MEIYKHAYKLIKNNTMGRKTVTLIFIFLFASSASGASDILLNGTSLYIPTGGSYGLYQGYIITLKSVSNDGSAWVELTSNDTFVKSEIVHIKGFFTYNKTNRTILSLKLDNIYSGSNDKALVSFYPAYQYIDPDMPKPKIIGIIPVETPGQDNNITPPKQKPVPETVIAVIGILFIVFVFYIIRKLW